MKPDLPISLALTAILLGLPCALLNAQSQIDPIEYPRGQIGKNRPFFIWQDLYNERDRKSRVSYRLTLRRQDKADLPPLQYTLRPELYYQYFYLLRIPASLAEGEYEYTVERILDDKPIRSRYYHYRKYPVINRFALKSGAGGEMDRLPPEYLIQYLYLDNENRLKNGYNALFFSASATTTLAVGLLFYKVLHYGLVSTIIYVVCFTSSAVGYSAAGYYTYKYYENRGRLQKILDLGNGVSLKGGIINKNVNTGVEMSF